MPDPSIIRSTYRAFLRQAHALPHIYLREFFRVRSTQYFRENIISRQHLPEDLLQAKLKTVQKELRRLRRANNGEKRALDHVLDLAYGRKGKLKHELMKHYLTNPAKPPPASIIPGVERSRPPSYSPELTTLLTSVHSRTLTKPLKPEALVNPPTLPARADPSSEEARLLGRLSLRREVNIRWRFHSGELKRTYFPLELSEKGSSNGEANARPVPRQTGAEELALVAELERLATSPHDGVPIPRRQRAALKDQKGDHKPNTHQESFESNFNSPKPVRFIRRRYRELLGRVPILRSDGHAKTGCSTTVSSLAIGHDFKGMRVPNAAQDDLDWILRSDLGNKES